MSVVGSRAASLASVSIAELFGSAFNDDHKLIAFSDSVQDAAHRAGFFGARTYSQVLRHAMAGFIRERGQGLTLTKVAEEFPKYWLQKKGNPASFVGTFIAPNMEWLKGYSDLKDTDAIPAGSDIADLVAKRMSWEVFSEFGLRSRIGRTLERSGVAVVQPDEDHLQVCATKLATRFREELEQLKDIQAAEVTRFLIGFLTRARQIGAFYTDDLKQYVQEGGERFVLNELSRYMPIFGTVTQVDDMITEGLRPRDMCITVRTNQLLDEIQGLLSSRSVESRKLSRQQADNRNLEGIRLATMHRVKGLEFKAVFMACLNDGVVPLRFPGTATQDPVEQNLLDTSERALFHVAATRAVKHLFLSSNGKASQYLTSTLNR